MKDRAHLFPVILAAAVILFASEPAQADQYHGNGDTGFGGAIGNGTLTLSDDGTNISGTLAVGGSMNDVLVLYIQSGTGGFTDTSGFNDQGDSCRQAISGVSASGRSLLTFASGCQPNYAIALAPVPQGGSTGGLWQLANGGNNSLVYLTNVNLAPLNNTGPYTFSFPGALIGMIPGLRSTIQVFGTYVRADGSRSTEAIAGNVTGTQGLNPFTQNAYASYTFNVSATLVKLPLGIWAERASGNAPTARVGHTAVWTGSEMIVWAGYSGGISYLNDGGRFDPAANAWTSLPTAGAPSARASHTAVWSGSEMIVWGGAGSGNYFNDGGRFNPVANSWTAMPSTGAPAGRSGHTAVWTGNELIVWGGLGFMALFNDGGRYDPAANTWAPVPTNGAPTARYDHTAVWTGSEMIIWGGTGLSHFVNEGGRYDPVVNGWKTLPTNGAPTARFDYTTLWTGNEMIIWGGFYFPEPSGLYQGLNDGGRYNPKTDGWTAVPTTGAPAARDSHTAVWTGSEMIIWGGRCSAGSSFLKLNDGGRYNVAANNWTALSSTGALASRVWHTAVWTGSEMIIFGGSGNSGYLSDTWSYYPYAPAVRTSRSSPTTADVAWPVWSTTLRLCQSTNLAAGPWTTVTNAVTQVGSENHVTVSPLSGGQFFRAEYP